MSNSMTNEEAIRRIKEHIEIHSRKEKGRCPLITEALHMAISALEYRIPKKPSMIKANEDVKIGAGIWKAGVPIYKCSRCNSFISRSSDYCNKCGQALDWSDSDE